MSTERELPPLRVKLIGDASSYNKMVQDAVAKTKDLGNAIGAIGKTITKQAATTKKEIEDNAKAEARAKKANEKATWNIIEAAEEANKLVTKHQKDQVAEAVKSAQIKSAAEKANNKWWQNHFKSLTSMTKSVARESVSAAGVVKTAWSVAAASMRNAWASPRSSNMGGSGLGAGLSSRADIYMHMNALRSLAQNTSSIANAFMEWQSISVSIQAFTKDAAEAAQVMAELKKQALASPFGIKDVGQAATMLMGYGVETQKAVELTGMLGDVAMGNKDKLNRLALAMAQINSLSKLQGQELRQLTEHGFNPLMTIAKQTAASQSVEDIRKRYAELDAMKRDGLITSEAVIAALKVETSEGGRFAGMAQKMANSVQGLIQQIRENIWYTVAHAIGYMEGNLQRALATVLHYTKMAREWVETHKEATIRILRTAAALLATAAAFHMVGFAISVFRWQLSSVFTIFTSIRAVLFPVTMGIGLLSTAFGQFGSIFRGTWGMISSLLMRNPLGFFTNLAGMAGPLLTVAAAFGGIGIMVALVRDSISQGLNVSVAEFIVWMEKAGKAVTGFFANFEENIRILVPWLGANMKQIQTAAEITFSNMLSAMAHNIAVFAENLPMLLVKGIQAGMPAMRKAMQESVGFLFSPFDAQARGSLANKMADLMTGNFHGKRGRDAAKATTAKDIVMGMVGSFKHGFEDGNPWSNIQLPAFNLKVPELGGVEMPNVSVPPAFKADWDKLLGGGAAKQGTATISDAVLSGSGDHAKKQYEYMERLRGARKGVAAVDPQLAQQIKATQLLEMIAKNTTPKEGGAKLEPVNLE